MAQTVFQERKSDKRLKAGALQLTLVITLIVTILLGSLIYLYAFYQQQDKFMARRAKLYVLMDSAMEIARSGFLDYGDTVLVHTLYEGDTIGLGKRPWGLYEQVSVTVKWQGDSLQKAFLLGLTAQDSTTLYVADEDRNISVSGKTHIQGTAYLPKAGIKPAFVDGKFYEGEKDIVAGERKTSTRQLPDVQIALLEKVYPLTDTPFANRLYGTHSFFGHTAYWYSTEPIVLERDSVVGNIVIQSDTVVEVRAGAALRDIICLAPVVRIASGFRGRIQVFAQDSIIVGDQVRLEYPSALVLDASDGLSTRRRISIGKQVEVTGTLLLYEAERSKTAHLLEIGEKGDVRGDVIVHGMLKYSKPLKIRGAAYCYRFITQTPRSLYENYLIDVDLDRSKKDPYMLDTFVWDRPQEKQQRHILSWVN